MRGMTNRGAPRALAAILSMVVAMVIAGAVRADPAGGYAITIDGSAEELEVVPIEGAPTTGSAAVIINGPYVDPQCLVVGKPGRYSFAFEGQARSGPARGYLTEPGKKRRLVWIKIWQEEAAHGRIVVTNPLHALTPAQIRDLRGVYIDIGIGSWSEEVVADLARLDLTRVCVSTSGSPAVPRFPAGIRYLAIDPGYDRDLSDLGAFGKLVFLSLNTYEQPFDAAWIPTLTSLQYLRLAVGTLENPNQLETLRSIRRLAIRAKKGIEQPDFLRAMPGIQTLLLHGSIDLAPIRELPNLVELDASESPARHLPALSLPALRKVNLMSSQVSDAEVERFRALNPNAVVLHRWTPLLRSQLLGASEVKVETVPLRRGDRSRSVTVRDTAEIAKLVEALEIDDPERFVSGCLPTHRLIFKRAGGPPKGEAIELAEGNSVLWSGFPGEAPLTQAGLRETRAWMAKHGMPWSDCSGRESADRYEDGLRRTTRAARAPCDRWAAA